MAELKNSPVDEEVVLYSFYSSYWSQMARLACVEKGVPFKKIDVNIIKGENYAPEYVAINPACEVPSLTHLGKHISGSQNIIDYLDQLTKKETTNPKRVEIEEFRRRCCALPISEITLGVVRHPNLLEGAKIPEKTLETFSKRVNRRAVLEENIQKYPQLADAYREKLSRVIDLEEQIGDMETVNQLLKQLESYLDEVDALLRTNAELSKNGPSSYNGWLFGEEFTNADIVLATLLARLDLLGLAGRCWDMTERLFLADYYRRLKQRPSFKQECVHHISDTD